MVLCLPLGLLEALSHMVPPGALDARVNYFKGDQAMLGSHQFGGDEKLSRMVQELINDVAVEEIKSEDYRVFTRRDGTKLLVLLQAEDLRSLADTARVELLDLIESLVTLSEPDVKEIYIGIKGRVAFGAVRTPKSGTKTGTLVDDRPLLHFYGPAPIPVSPRRDEEFQPSTRLS